MSVRRTGSVLRGTIAAWLTAVTILLAACGPPYLADTYATSTPKPASLDPTDLARTPVVVLAFMAPAALQGLSPTMSHALSGALAEVSPPIREIPTRQTLNRLTDKGLATEYADMRAGFARNGMLDRQALRRLGSGLGSRYVLLPGLAQFGEETLDKFEAAGIKLVRNRVTTLRLGCNSGTRRPVTWSWSCPAKELRQACFRAQRRQGPWSRIARKLLVRMIQDGWRLEDGNQITPTQ